MDQNSKSFELFLVVILLVKIGFIIAVFLKFKANRNKDYASKAKYSKMTDICHSLFTLLMGILLLILYNPRNNGSSVCVSGHTMTFIFIFGILSVVGIIHEEGQKYLHKE
tara:strand:+ start:295 stop:624 length:330 start_codon:yes stop_codon:yes gene_type:complete